jgi:CSLREA domain-containing protein
MAAVLASPAQAATLTVNTAADEQNTNDQCSLREAMINANQNDQSGSTDCAAGTADETINFDLGSTATITLGSPLPVINGFHPAGLIIDGGSADITISGDNKYRVFEVAFVEVTLSNLTVANGANATFGECGGGINNNTSATVTVSNSTLSGNSASFAGGGIEIPSGIRATFTFKNTIVAANDAGLFGPDVRGFFTSQGHNLIGQSECTVGCFTNEDQVGTSANPIDPMLGPLANNGGPTKTHALLEGSPAIDKGVAVEGITTDQRGVSRQQGGRPT